MSCAHHAAPVDGQCPACLLELAADEEPELAPGTLVAGRFRIAAPLGRGGMGEVYRADDIKLGHAVALKFVPATEETLREVRAGREIAHPNVCRIYDVVDVDANAAIVMELVDGDDLSQIALSHQKALDVARDICAGLEAIHERGIAHGDLKPSNVMVDGRGRARITDLGLSHRAGESARFGGTPAYMAPEQFETRKATPQSDVYALGLLLRELLGDEHEVIVRCLRRDPAERPSARQVATALAAEATPSPEYVAASEQAPRLSAPAAWGWAAGASALLALLIAWPNADRVRAPAPAATPRPAYIVVLALTLAAGAVLAWRNLRAGRVDRAGAVRVALWVFVCEAVAGVLGAQHRLALDPEATLLTTIAGAAALAGLEVWIAYAALEPFARRDCPRALVSWMRVLRRRISDPLVARDVLIGLTAGLAMRALELPRHAPAEATMSILATIAHSLGRGAFYALFALFLLVLLRMALRREALAAIVWLTATTAVWSHSPIDVPFVTGQMLIILLLLQRLGLLAAAIAVAVYMMVLL